jgi:hypothetical protein
LVHMVHKYGITKVCEVAGKIVAQHCYFAPSLYRDQNAIFVYHVYRQPFFRYGSVT